MNELSDKILGGDHRAIARVITLVENNAPESTDIMKELHRYSGHAHVLGVTGVMGCGKSSLICELTVCLRKQGKKVGIIAIDPTSPFTGGALLGDRIRMMNLSTDSGVFIRSMGTRGMLGGLTSSVCDVVEIFDAAGMEYIIIETVGVGQAEVDIIRVADTTLVVLVPGLGDAVQTIKAGMMEIADIFVVNKADKPGVEQTVAELESLVDLIPLNTWKIPIVSTSVKQKKGIDTLLQRINDHMTYLHESQKISEKRYIRFETEVTELIKKRLITRIFDESKVKKQIDECIRQITTKELDPYTAADKILNAILK